MGQGYEWMTQEKKIASHSYLVQQEKLSDPAADKRQRHDHVRYQEHHDKRDNQLAVSLGSFHVLLTDFPTAASNSCHTVLQGIPCSTSACVVLFAWALYFA
jgi:hypothetical protein